MTLSFHKIRFTTALLFAIFFLNAALFAQDKAAKIDQLLQKAYENQQFNGSALVAEKGKIIFKKGYGYANFDWKIPNTPETKHRIGSITKQFVGMLIMQLVEAGKVDLQGKITTYLPEYRKDTGDKITIHHLLTHTSGIPSYTGLRGFWSDSTRNPYSIDYMIKHFHSGDLEFEPGSRYNYNNSGYYLLAVIVERVTGKSFEENLQEKILKPLQMTHSGADREERILENRAYGYMRQLGGDIHEPHFHMPNVLGAGDMYATVGDLYLWDQALYSDKLLSKKHKKTMFTPFLNGYAYGWGVYSIPRGESGDSLAVVGHSGGINGFNTRITRLIDDRHLIVLFNNTGGTNLSGLSRAITAILYDQPFELPKIPISQAIGKIIMDDGIEKALTQYQELKTKQSDRYNFQEFELNQLGYQLLGMQKVTEAIEIFKLNIGEYPEAFNPYDSLGEAYMINGQTDLAIKYYAKSLEMNPNNRNAIRMLQRINTTN